MAKGLAQLSEATSHAIQGHARWMGSSEEFWQIMLHWKRKWQLTLVFLYQEPYKQYEKAKRNDCWKVNPPRLESVQYATGEELRTTTNSSKKSEVAGPKQKWCSVVNVSVGESKLWCYKEQYCIVTGNVRSMDQGKLHVVKQEIARFNIDILGISELEWTGQI